MKDFRYERVKKICADLLEMATVQSVPITGFRVKRGFYLTPAEADAAAESWRAFDTERDTWPGPDAHYWFRATLIVPESFDGRPLWLHFLTQVTFWDAVNPQFLLFVNGEIAQGLDVNHPEVRLTEKATAGSRYVIDLQAYTGRDNDRARGSTAYLRLSARMLEIDGDILSCYYNLNVPNRIVSRLEHDSQSRISLELALEKAVNMLDLRVPYSAPFYESIRACNAFVKEEIYTRLAGDDSVIATCIGHTHIDVAWWWTVAQTREKVVRSFATVLRLMEEYPEYKFMSSQPQLYAFLKERYPGLYEKVRGRIAEGRWEPEGGMWVEADCNVTSGESLVRQFLHGKKFFHDEFGKESVILWLPDVFGYSAALPQIMRKSGIKYFMTTKIAWNQFNKLPVDTFWWRGIDGTEIFTHLITTQDIDQPEDSFFTTYNGVLDPVCLMRGWERYQQKDINNDILVAYGYGDGGGGPSRGMIETGRRMQSGIIGSPKVRFATVRQYFDELYARTAENKDLPKWVGELYLEFHRGTYTSMARNKRANRKCELLWQDVEFYSVFASLLGVPYDKGEIYKSWEVILLNQFHDILPGSCIKDVYDVTKVEYEALERRARKLIDEKTRAIAGALKAKKDDLVVFNSLSFERSDTVRIPADGCDGVTAFKAADGVAHPAQHTADGALLISGAAIPAKGCAVLTPVIGDGAQESAFTLASPREIETPYYRIKLNDVGQLTSIFDKEERREVLKSGGLGNVLRVYEDKPIDYDNWNIEIYYTQKSWAVDDLRSAEWIESGPVRSVLRLAYRFCESDIVQDVVFYTKSRRIDFETYVNWRQHDLLLKAEFDVDINTSEATYDIQFGSLKRPTHRNTSWDIAKFEVCGHKWADVSEGGYGVALLNDCKYGYGIRDGKMTLSLLKSGTMPNPVADQEEHRFVYALLPHKGDYNAAYVQHDAYCLNVPTVALRMGRDGTGALDAASLFTLSAANVIAETVKPAEDGSGVIVRMYEDHNARTPVTLTWHTKMRRIVECDLMENEIGEPAENTSAYTFTIKPFEIKTFKIC